MAADKRKDPYRSFNFQVVWDGVPCGGFSEVSGLSPDCDPADWRTDGIPPPKLARLRRRASVTLKRGVADRRLRDWCLACAGGKPARRELRIVQMDERRTAVLSWRLASAWPGKWQGPELKAEGTEVAMESLTLECEGITTE